MLGLLAGEYWLEFSSWRQVAGGWWLGSKGLAGWWIGSGLVGCLVACLLGCLAGSGFPSILVNRPLHNCEGLQFPDGFESIGFQK